MEFLINKWIQEALVEYEKAKVNQNYYQMDQMKVLAEALRKMRDKLLNLR